MNRLPQETNGFRRHREPRQHTCVRRRLRLQRGAKRYSQETRAWHKSIVTEEERKFLRSLPPLCHAWLDGKSALLGHATPNGDVFRYTKEDDVAVSGLTMNIVLLGHTHVQFRKQVGATLVVNPGSVGLARDGAEACYTECENDEIILKRIPYDVGKTINALRHAPISDESEESLIKVWRGEWEG